MATDGVKIIDGDTACDLYGIFMDAYDAGADSETLRNIYEQDKQQYSFDDFEYEICITVYALAFWEIGEITSYIIEEVEKVIAKGACVTDWTEQIGEKAGKARRKELDKLWTKINKPNGKIRKRKKYATVKNLLFNPGDILTFQLPDGTYGLTVVADVMQYRGECDYMLCRTTFNAATPPTMENLAGLRILGSLVPSGHAGIDTGIMEKLQNLTAAEMRTGGMERVMAELTGSMPKIKMPWVVTIQHKSLITENYLSKFEKIGNVPLRSNTGSSTFAASYQSFCESFYIRNFERNRNHPYTPDMGEFAVDELTAQHYHEYGKSD